MRTTSPGQSTLLLLDVVDVLDRHSLPYAVVGAIAAAFHGVVRASQDADAVISLQMNALRELEKSLRGENLQTELRKGALDDPIAFVLIVQDAFGNRVDLLSGVRGMETAALTRSLAVPLLGHKICVIGAEDFVAMKIHAGSPLDIEDAKGVLAVSRERLDIPQLKRIARLYGVGAARSLAALLDAAPQ